MEGISIIELINGVGFPIAIAVYLIWDRTKLMKEFIASNDALTKAVTSLANKVGVDING